VTESLEQFCRVYENLKQEVTAAIRTQEVEYFKNSTELYNQRMQYDSPQHILNRKMGIDNEALLDLIAALRPHTDWRVPGMIIRPGMEDFIEHLVPCDPLYVVDTHLDLITPSVNRFNEQYRSRLRQYVINENRKTMFSELPMDQFGLIFAYNFFNYKPAELIERYVAELYRCLRPGGLMIFTFNNCDRAHGVELAERKFMCYTPAGRLLEFMERTGFDVVSQQTRTGDLCWIECRRPGQITSLRGGQTLAKIVR
jgi:SAM-dependent methyltransferase